MLRSPRRFLVLSTLALSLMVPTAASANDGPPDFLLDVPGGLPAFFPKPLCHGIRGNGPRIFAHFGAIGQLTEHYGPPHCAAGGSSGSITTYLIESVHANALSRRCAGRRCSRADRWARVSLFYKSAAGLTDAGLGGEVQTLIGLLNTIQEQGIPGLIQQDPEAGIAALMGVLQDLGDIVNPEVFALLAQSPDPVFHALDLIQGLRDAVEFKVDSPLVFVRTGVLNFPVLVDLFGRVGSFYAGYGDFYDAVGVEAWLGACARPSVGLTWAETAALPAGSGSQTCGEVFTDLVDAYRAAFTADPAPRNRLDDPIGIDLPVLAVTGVLTGDAIALWEDARAQYFAAQPVDFSPDFADVRFGYFGQWDDLTRVLFGLARKFPADPVTAKYAPLGPATWREILGSSPAEPGFVPAVPLSSGLLSVGGWADPLRVQVLQALGGRHVVAVNRRGGENPEGFTPAVTRLLGASDEELSALYALENPESSFTTALRSAEGVWCSDWDAPDLFDVDGLFADGYDAPMLTADRFFLRRRDPYPGASPDVQIAGCTPDLVD